MQQLYTSSEGFLASSRRWIFSGPALASTGTFELAQAWKFPMGAASSSEVVAEKLREMGEGTKAAFYSKLGPLSRTGSLYTPT